MSGAGGVLPMGQTYPESKNAGRCGQEWLGCVSGGSSTVLRQEEGLWGVGNCGVSILGEGSWRLPFQLGFPVYGPPLERWLLSAKGV